MIDGTGAVLTKEDVEQAAEIARRLLANSVAEFERRGIDYAKGYLAARLGRKPLWLARFLVNHYDGFYDRSWTAAVTVVKKAGVEPHTCGHELYDNLPELDDVLDEIRREKRERKA